MNELMNATTLSSREIAELTGKPHSDVLKAIRAMEPAWKKATEGNFSLSEYKDGSGRKLPMFQLTKTECLYVATKFNDEARAKLIIRWEQLEQRKPSSLEQLTSAIFNLTQTIIENNQQVNERLQRLEQNKLLPPAGPIKINQPNDKPDYIDARDNAYDFIQINHFNIRRITLNEVLYYSINDFCRAINANTSAWQIAKKINRNRPTAQKVWIFGNTHPAWFTTKSGLRLIISGSRTLRDDSNLKLDLRRALS